MILTPAQIEARRRARALRTKQIAGNAYLWLLLVVLYAPILLIIQMIVMISLVMKLVILII